MKMPRIVWGPPGRPDSRDDLGWFNSTQLFLAAVALLGMGAHALSFAWEWTAMLRSLCLSAIVAGGCVSAGALLGFVFGIPRTLAAGKGEGNEGESSSGTRSNTNLERVSDWLTGMIVGAGLIELDALLSTFRNVARTLAEGFAAGDPTGEPFAYAYAMFLMVLAGVSGFLIGYIVTRRFLPLTFARGESEAADQDRENKVLGLVTQMIAATDRQHRGAGRTLIRPAASLLNFGEPLAGAAPAGDSVGEAAAEDAGSPDSDDPNKGRFGGAPAANGRRLSAKVVCLSANEESAETAYYRVTLRVVTEDPRKPLATPVDFHLHPTFSPAIQTVLPESNEAVKELVVWGSFTVGAVTDGGTTRLELDLAEVEGVSKRFRET